MNRYNINPKVLFKLGLYEALDIWFNTTQYQLTPIAREVRRDWMMTDHKRGYMEE